MAALITMHNTIVPKDHRPEGRREDNALRGIPICLIKYIDKHLLP